MSFTDKMLDLVNSSGWKKFVPWFAAAVLTVGAAAVLWGSCNQEAQNSPDFRHE